MIYVQKDNAKPYADKDQFRFCCWQILIKCVKKPKIETVNANFFCC